MNESLSGSLRIALVEDETAHAEGIRRAFAAAGSEAQITAVRTLREFRELVDAAAPDIALMDLNLPDGSAVETLTAPPEAGAFPILIMTSYGNQQLAVDAIKAGALDYIVKSAESFGEMPRIVARALREWRLLRERVQALDALRESERRFRQMAEAMGETFWLRDIRTGKILYVNPAFESQWGLSRQSLMADPDLFMKSIHPEDRNLIETSSKPLSDSAAPHSFSEEFRIIRPDGSIRWIQTRVNPVFDESRTLIRYAGIAEDITASRLAQGELLESEEKYRSLYRQFRALLDAIPEEITVQTPDLKVIWANRAADAKLGGDSSALIGQSCHLLRFGSTTPCDNCPVLESLDTASPARAVKTDLGGRLFESRAIPVLDQGEVINVINVVRDITDQTKLEEQLRDAQKMESIGTLAGGVAHDFNNILTSVVGYGHMALLKAGPDDPVRSYVQSMLEGANRAAKLTDGLLSFSRKQMLEKRVVDVVDIVRKTERLVAGALGKSISLDTRLPAEAMTILADADQVGQILTHLASNARDAMPGGGRFTLAVERVILDEAGAAAIAGGSAGAYVVISATDSGPGMTDPIRRRVFEPFYTTKEVGKGTGLGLSIIHGIVTQHEGFIDLQSGSGAGTTFRLFFPALDAPESRGGTPAAVPDSLHGTETVLLADDESAVRHMIRTILGDHGYRVVAAADGEEAVRLFREDPGGIHLLLFDLVMPRMGGKQAAEIIRKIRPQVPALFMSGFSDDFVRRREVLGTEMSVLLKPLSPPDLLKKIRSVLESA